MPESCADLETLLDAPATRTPKLAALLSEPTDRVVGYYALATAGVEKAEAPDQITKGGVPKQIPCLLLARLAVDGSEQNRRVGKGLLVDAIRRAVRVSDEVGVRALLIHARDDEARSFYEHQGEFVQSPTDSLQLFLHLKHARVLLLYPKSEA